MTIVRKLHQQYPTAVALVLGAVIVAVSLVVSISTAYMQDGSNATAPIATPTPTSVISRLKPIARPTPRDPDTSALTDAELTEGRAIAAKLQPILAEQGAMYQRLLSTATEGERCSAATAFVLAVKLGEPLQRAQDEWLGRVRTAHKCPACEVVNNRLVGRAASNPAGPPNEKP